MLTAIFDLRYGSNDCNDSSSSRGAQHFEVKTQEPMEDYPLLSVILLLMQVRTVGVNGTVAELRISFESVPYASHRPKSGG